MKSKFVISVVVLLLTFGCDNKVNVPKEEWVDKPLSEWPIFALTNEISFKDTTYIDFANSFLIDTGTDTLGVSCKHIFMVFEDHFGIKSIDLGEDFNYWKLYPKNSKGKNVSVKRLINTNVNEEIGRYNTLKVRDWIIFELNSVNPELYPLKIRYTPIKKNEIVYSVSWGMNQKNNEQPVLMKFKCFENVGDYFYTQKLTQYVNPIGRSGSPVIDENGYLVGIISGAEGKLGVVGGVKYLQKIIAEAKVD